LRFDELNLSEKWSCLEPGLALLMDAEGKRWNSSTVAEWLIACRQSPNAVRALWEPLCLAALNEKIEHASAALFSRVVRRMLLTSSQNASILLSRVGLGDLFIPPAMDFLAATGSPISCGVPATRLIQEGHRITAVETADGRTWTADAFVLATPWRATRALAPEGSALHKTCGTLSGSPIVSIYLWTDREVTPEPMLGLLDSPLQWCFNLNKIRTDIPPNVHLLCFVISAAHKWDGVPPASLIAMAEKEMKRLLPQAADAKVLRGFPYRALDATLRAIPEYQAHRPDTLTEWSNLFLAGDWTNTGLPSTIEGAVLSGLRAAETLENRETF
jgi:squalene-associated FAD-dependent desaturase